VHAGFGATNHSRSKGRRFSRKLCAVAQTSSSRDLSSATRNFYPIAIASRRSDSLARPGEGCAVNPDPVHDDRQLARDGDDRPRNPRRLATAMPQALSADHRCTRVSRLSAAWLSALRTAPSPALLIEPLRSISPEAYLRGVRRKCGPRSRAWTKRAGSSTPVNIGQGNDSADPGTDSSRRHTMSDRTMSSIIRCRIAYCRRRAWWVASNRPDERQEPRFLGQQLDDTRLEPSDEIRNLAQSGLKIVPAAPALRFLISSNVSS
jgi:hypothetical protein